MHVVHALPTDVRPTGGSGLWPGVVLGPHFHVGSSSVGRSCNQPRRPADVFSSPDHDDKLVGDDMAPLEHCLLSRPLSSPYPLVDAIQAAAGSVSDEARSLGLLCCGVH